MPQETERYRVARGDISGFEGDAVVTAANAGLTGGGGVDAAVHAAGGPTVIEECREIGGCLTGDAVATSGGELPYARWIIHAVGPIWDPLHPEACDEALASAYRRSVEVAAELGARSVAFPNISTGVYGFPKDRAAPIAIAAALTAAAKADVAVTFYCYDDENARLYESRTS